MEVVQRVLLGAEAQVVVLVEPDGERVEVRDEEPLPDVELGLVDQERPLCERTNKKRQWYHRRAFLRRHSVFLVKKMVLQRTFCGF